VAGTRQIPTRRSVEVGRGERRRALRVPLEALDRPRVDVVELLLVERVRKQPRAGLRLDVDPLAVCLQGRLHLAPVDRRLDRVEVALERR